MTVAQNSCVVAGARLRGPRAAGSRQIGKDQRRNIDAGNRTSMVPERKAGIDLQQVKLSATVAFEIELGDAAQAERFGDSAASFTDAAAATGRRRTRIRRRCGR